VPANGQKPTRLRRRPARSVYVKFINPKVYVEIRPVGSGHRRSTYIDFHNFVDDLLVIPFLKKKLMRTLLFYFPSNAPP
jgi:hypothetical protein